MTFTQTEHPRKLYRSRNGLFLGVCKGVAEYSQIPTFWVRFFTVFAVIVTAFWPVLLIYLACAIFLKPSPLFEPKGEEDWEFYEEYSHDRKWALSRLKKRFDQLEKRTRRMESVVTEKEYDWERRFNSGS